MGEHERQTVAVVLTLRGVQRTAVAAVHAGSDSAAVTVRIGRALIYMHGPQTAATFVGAWRARRFDVPRLPAHVPAGSPILGMREPVVMVDAFGAPPVLGRLERPPGQESHLRIQVGRIVFDVRDAAAYASTLAALRDAEHLSPATFPAPGRRRAPRPEAFDTVARALPTSRASQTGRGPGTGSRPGFAWSRPVQRPRAPLPAPPRHGRGHAI